MATYLGRSCLFVLSCMTSVNYCKIVRMFLSLLVFKTGCGIVLVAFLSLNIIIKLRLC